MASFRELLRQLEAAHSAETARLEFEIKQLRAEKQPRGRLGSSECSAHRRGSSDAFYHSEDESKRSAELGKTETVPTVYNTQSVETYTSNESPAVIRENTSKTASSIYSSIPHAPNKSMGTRFVLRNSLLYKIGIGVNHGADHDATKVLEKEGRLLGHLHLFVRGPLFESFFASLIFANAIVMAAETQYDSFEVKSDLGLSDSISNNAWPNLVMFFTGMGWTFGVLFTLELIMKLVGLRLNFVWDLWNWIDAVIVVVWLISSTGSNVGQTFRLFRLLRLIRLLRLVRTIQSFDALYLMTTALKGSVSILAWAAVLLFVIQLLLSLLFTQLLSEYYFANLDIDLAKRVLVFEYFGSFTRSMFTLFQLTLGTWAEPSRILIENVSEWFIVFTLTHKLIIGFAAIGVINGVFMQETFKVAAVDDMIMLRQKQRAMAVHARKMRNLIEAVDKEGRGYMDFDQFQLIMTDPQVKTWLASMEFSNYDVVGLYGLLDDGDQKLTVDELIAGVGHLKGNARSMDLALLNREINSLNEQVKRMEQIIHELVLHFDV